MTLSLFIGFAFAYAIVRGGWRFLDNLSLLPLATSAVDARFWLPVGFSEAQLEPVGGSF